MGPQPATVDGDCVAAGYNRRSPRGNPLEMGDRRMKTIATGNQMLGDTRPESR
jgi:hypothetical protein